MLIARRFKISDIEIFNFLRKSVLSDRTKTADSRVFVFE